MRTIIDGDAMRTAARIRAAWDNRADTFFALAVFFLALVAIVFGLFMAIAPEIQAAQVGISGQGPVTSHGHLTATDGGTLRGTAMQVRRSAWQAITCNAWTVVSYDSVEFDTLSSWQTGTAIYKPTVAGYYLVHATANLTAATGFTGNGTQLVLQKNGATIQLGHLQAATTVASNLVWTLTTTSVVYMNGTTDYLQALVAVNGATSCGINGTAPNPSVFSAIKF